MLARDQAINARVTTFVGGRSGSMRVVTQTTMSGEPIAQADRVEMFAGAMPALPPDTAWSFHGVTSHDRYTTRAEKAELVSRQVPIGRPASTSAALILLRKRAEWWTLTQDERRAILEADSHHIEIGLRYLPAISRNLLHCRDLVDQAPFDFIGFLDFAPQDADLFEEMLGQLRATKEWSFIDREVDIRLDKAS